MDIQRFDLRHSLSKKMGVASSAEKKTPAYAGVQWFFEGIQPRWGDFTTATDKIQIRNGFILKPNSLLNKKDSCHAGFYFLNHA
jgi:hypothetical protein